MKISLITLHHITNFGSLLQSYATQRYLMRFGHSIDIIDFVPSGTTLKKAIFAKSNRSFVSKALRFLPLTVCNCTQTIVMRRFITRNLNLTSRTYHNYSELNRACPDADLYMSGSDQIWNTQNDNLPDDIKAYYLCFVPDGKKKISYASSFGKTDFSEKEADEISSWLSRYQAVSVREDTAMETLKKLGIDNGRQVLDPTLLLTPEEWLSFINRKAPMPGYLFVYNLNRNPLITALSIGIANEKKLRIVNFADTYQFIHGAENRIVNTAYDFVNYIAHADYIVTDSFHGTAFSVNFGRQFVCVPPPKYSCRVESLLRLLQLTDRMVTNEKDGMEKSHEMIDTDRMKRILSEERIKSAAFMSEAIEN